MARANTVGFLKALCFNQFERKSFISLKMIFRLIEIASAVVSVDEFYQLQ